MFDFFRRKPPVCSACHRYMVPVQLQDVPEGAVREFARMNHYAPMSFSGWFKCEEHYIHIHQPTLEKTQSRYR
jgi:hypothetical protein